MIQISIGLMTGVFGRLGGCGDDFWMKHRNWPRWMFQSWVRDWLISITCYIAAYFYGVHSWWILSSILLTAAALSTYWDDIFGYDNYFCHGLFVGLASFPIAWQSGLWDMFLIRTLSLSLWMGIWSMAIDNDNLEEFGRYFPVGYSLFLIC